MSTTSRLYLEVDPQIEWGKVSLEYFYCIDERLDQIFKFEMETFLFPDDIKFITIT